MATNLEGSPFQSLFALSGASLISNLFDFVADPASMRFILKISDSVVGGRGGEGAQLARQAAMSESTANRLAKMVGKPPLFKGTLTDQRNRAVHVFVNKLQNYLQAGHVSDDVENLKLNLTKNIYNKTLSYTCFPVSCPNTSPVTLKLAIIRKSKIPDEDNDTGKPFYPATSIGIRGPFHQAHYRSPPPS
jgi:hypothetical protein